MNYILHLLIMVGIYLPLAYSLNLTLGYGGLMSFCHAVFYGTGAYAYAILVMSADFSPFIAFAITLSITLIISFLIGMVSLRFRGALFLFVTLGFQMIFSVMIYNWITLTNGPNGIPGIGRPELFGFTLRYPIEYFPLIVLMNLVLITALFSLYNSSFGITLKALRENEKAAEALGTHSNRIYMQAFVLSAIFAAIPGIFFATYMTYIDPSSFTIDESIFQVAILLLGGSGNQKGPFFGVVILILLPEALRFIGFPDAVAHNLREIFYGLTLIVLMYFRPQGIAGEFKVG